jgi:replicative DNA helicase
MSSQDEQLGKRFAEVVREEARDRKISFSATIEQFLFDIASRIAPDELSVELETMRGRVVEAFRADGVPLDGASQETQRIFDLIESQMRATLASTNDVPVQHVAALGRRVRHLAKNPPPNWLTGFHQLDHVTKGFHPGELTVLGARPAIGKSALAADIARHLSHAGIPVFVVSAEMSAEAITRRMAAQQERLNAESLRTGEEIQWEGLDRALKRLQAYPLYITDQAYTVASIRKAVERLDVKVVIVDYLHKLKPSRNLNSTRAAVEDVSHGLKQLTLTHKIAVLALASLSRLREGEKPTLAHLRETGNLEHDADVVWLMSREEEHASIDIAKNREGQCGRANFRFVADSVAFEDADFVPKEVEVYE